jgi:hypothetical protein
MFMDVMNPPQPMSDDEPIPDDAFTLGTTPEALLTPVVIVKARKNANKTQTQTIFTILVVWFPSLFFGYLTGE